MEILANELRIGNKIIFGERIINVTYHDIRNILKMIALDGKVSEYELIPLTEEWLIKMSLAKGVCKNEYIIDTDKSKYNQIYLLATKHDNKIDIWFNDDAMTTIKYVHQLQNLYFALTGEELTIKE